jgi:hypothetical protein
MWFNVLGMGIKTAAKLYSDKQKTKEALSEARLLHAEKMRRGEIEYKGWWLVGLWVSVVAAIYGIKASEIKNFSK